MPPFPSSPIQQAIVRLLIQGPSSGPILLTRLEERRAVSKQAMYLALRTLMRREILVKHSGVYSINNIWLVQLQGMGRVRAPQFHQHDFMSLRDGERIRYDFKNARSLDVFWNHAILTILDATPGESFFSLAPHCWFLLARVSSERALRDTVTAKGGQYLITTTHATPLDKIIIPEFDRVHSQYYMDKSLARRHSLRLHINVIGTYIIEVHLSHDQAYALDAIYKKYTRITPQTLEELDSALALVGKITCSISNNARKASRLKKSLSSAFVLR